jgi:hypothetical protein
MSVVRKPDRPAAPEMGMASRVTHPIPDNPQHAQLIDLAPDPGGTGDHAFAMTCTTFPA